MRLRLTLPLLLACATCLAQSQPGCAPSPDVEQILRPDKPDPSIDSLAVFEKAVAANPGDFHLLAEYLVRTAMDISRAERIRLADRLRANPQGPATETLAALSWLGVETPKTIAGLKAAQAKHPSFPWPGYYLAVGYSFPKFRDNKQSAELAAVFLKSCPDYFPAYSYVSRVTLPEIQRPLAAQLRAKLESRSLSPRDLNMYSTLWTLEFRSTPVDRHAPLREQVKKDLERAHSFAGGGARNLSLELSAAQLTGDAETMKQAESRRRGSPSEGFEEFLAWQKENPYPRPGDPQAARDASISRRRQKISEFAAKYPNNSMFRDMVLNEALSDKSKTDEELTLLAAEYLKKADEQPARSGVHYQRIAQLWLDRNLHLDQVPDLLAKARKGLDQQSGFGRTDLIEVPPGAALMNINNFVLYWTLVSNYERKRGTPEGAAKAYGEMECLLAANKPGADEKNAMALNNYWRMRGSYYKLRADHAEQDRLMLDTLAWLRKTVDSDRQSTSPFHSRPDSPVMQKARELWATLGGSPETFSAWLDASSPTPDRPKPAVASSGLPPRDLTLALPAMDLKDMEGKTWTLANIKGKATLINFWATWCGPCRDELPHLQKLYNKTRERKDLQVITLNMDDNPGVIEPFLTQNNYTFPVLLAKDYADASFKIAGIPTNYVTDSTATVKLEYLGFGGSGDDWIKQMLAALEQLKTPAVN